MIKLKGNNAYFLPNVHKNNLSTFPLNKICKDSFTFCVRVKINWDKMETPAWGGIIMRNGMHSGLVAVKSDKSSINSGFSINGEVWTNIDGTPTPKTLSLMIDKDNKDDFLDLTYIYETSGLLTIMSDKSVSLDRVEGAPSIIFDKELNKNKYYYFKQLEIERDIIDYRDSWLWFGCASAFASCNKEHRQYLQGEISHFGVFGKKLNEDEVKHFFDSCDSNLKTANLNDLIPVSYSDFKTQTPHKSFDYSGNGNHIVMYNPDWGAI